MIDGVRSRPARSVQVEDHPTSVGTNPDAWISTMTSLIAGSGSGRSTNVIPAAPAAGSVTTIAFIDSASADIVSRGPRGERVRHRMRDDVPASDRAPRPVAWTLARDGRRLVRGCNTFGRSTPARAAWV